MGLAISIGDKLHKKKMDIIESADIKVRNSLIISGPLGAESDKELIDHLKQHGSIARFVSIDAPNTKFHEHVVVEYTDSTALQSLKSQLPGTFPCQNEEGTHYLLKPLVDVYAPELSSTTTQTYLEQLQSLAQATGKTLKELLATELTKLNTAACVAPTDATGDSPMMESTQNVVHTSSESGTLFSRPQLTTTFQPMVSNAAAGAVGNTAAVPPASLNLRTPSVTAKLGITPEVEDNSPHHVPTGVYGTPNLRINDVNPPEIQRVVVEHIVRNADVSSSVAMSNRLRSFSGKCPHPNSEVDYDTWRANVELVIKDPAISDLHRVRKILESLLTPAADIVKQLGPQASPTDYLQLLDSAFGTVDDGAELFAKFMNMLQDTGEKPSQYLNRLQVILSQTVKRGGVAPTEQDEYLRRQFCRGCWDSTILASLQLEQRKHNPPSFSELLLLLRTEEDRQTAKAARMKQHLGIAKQRAAVNLQCTCTHLEEENTSLQVSNPTVDTLCDTQNLKKQVAGLQSQMAGLKAQNRQAPRPQVNYSQPDALIHGLQRQMAELQSQILALKAQTTPPSTTEANTRGRASDLSVPTTARMQQGKPRPWYCFRCGEDGHTAPNCDGAPNQALVAAKKEQLHEKQQRWEAQNRFPSAQQLN